MKDNPHTDNHFYLFVAYLTAMPVAQILSLTQENAVDLRSVGYSLFQRIAATVGGNDTDPVKNMNLYHHHDTLRNKYLSPFFYAFSFITKLQSKFFKF